VRTGRDGFSIHADPPRRVRRRAPVALAVLVPGQRGYRPPVRRRGSTRNQRLVIVRLAADDGAEPERAGHQAAFHFHMAGQRQYLLPLKAGDGDRVLG